MKLWTVRGYMARLPDNEVTPAYAILSKEDKPLLIASCGLEAEAQQICDEHNAWVILAEKTWMPKPSVAGGWVILSWSAELAMYENKPHDTPVAAILAANRWMKEKGL